MVFSHVRPPGTISDTRRTEALASSNTFEPHIAHTLVDLHRAWLHGSRVKRARCARGVAGLIFVIPEGAGHTSPRAGIEAVAQGADALGIRGSTEGQRD